MTIRTAKKDDTGALLFLLSEVLRIHNDIRPDIFKSNGTKYSESELSDIIESKNTPVFVVENDTRVIGYCFTIIKEQEETAIFRYRKDLYIDDLCVEENFRTCGVGKSLDLYVEQYAKEIGCTSVTLNVWHGNDNAIKFYDKMGLIPRKTLLEKQI